MRKKRRKNNFSSSIILILILTLLASVGQLMFKLASRTISLSFKDIFLNHYLIFGFILYGISFITLIIILKKQNLSSTYPALSLSFVWVFFISIIFLGEIITINKIVGTTAILTGVFLLNNQQKQGENKSGN